MGDDITKWKNPIVIVIVVSSEIFVIFIVILLIKLRKIRIRARDLQSALDKSERNLDRVKSQKVALPTAPKIGEVGRTCRAVPFWPDRRGGSDENPFIRQKGGIYSDLQTGALLYDSLPTGGIDPDYADPIELTGGQK